MTRRYVYAPGEGTPLVWYEGSGTSDKRWLLSDERGSVIAVTDAGGDAIDIRSYDEFGNPHDTTPANGGRFGYTGQQWIAAVGLWDYKARMYSPALGRFMQTDPIGYGDGLNWYNYVGGDPVNRIDPSGRECIQLTNAKTGELIGYIATEGEVCVFGSGADSGSVAGNGSFGTFGVADVGGGQAGGGNIGGAEHPLQPAHLRRRTPTGRLQHPTQLQNRAFYHRDHLLSPRLNMISCVSLEDMW